MSEPSANVYDQVLYPSQALPQADPRRLETLACLHGMTPAPAQACRVLEVGCGTALNLIALATILPDSEFVGVDLAEQPIGIGRAHAAELGLTNLDLHVGDIRAIDDSWGSFDYIIAHGVYSWVPADVRDALLQLCRNRLAADGVAYVSYNTLPGGHLRRMIRDMLLHHVSPDASPEARLSQARDLLGFLARGIGSDDVLAAPVRAEAERTARHVDALLFHDDLAEINVPVHFGDFVAQARRCGLDYLVEADFNEGQELELPAEVLEQLDRLGRVERAQYLDFLKCRRFRQTLLCRQEVNRWEPQPEMVRRLFIAADARLMVGATVDLTPGVDAEFQNPAGATIQSRDAAVKAAMLVLGVVWPRCLSFAALVERARQQLAADSPFDEEELARVLLLGYATGLVDLYVTPPAWGGPPMNGNPTSARLPRWQLLRGEATVTSLLLRSLVVDDDDCRTVMLLADGTRSVEDLEERLPGAEAQIARLTRLSLFYPLPSAESR